MNSSTARFAAFGVAVALSLVLGLVAASPASAQDDTSTVRLGGGSCSGDNVEIVTETTGGEQLVSANATPDEDGNWEVAVTLPALSEAVIAWGTCFAGDNVIANYSPISLRVQPGVDVGGVIELRAVPVEGAEAAGEETPEAIEEAPEETTMEELPETGPVTVPLAALSIALIAGGLGLAFVSREQQLATVKAWPRSHWDA